MTDEELKEIERRCFYGTNGPWIPMIEGFTHSSGSDFIMTGVNDTEDYKNPKRGNDLIIDGAFKDDLIFIANAKQDIPKLVQEIRRLKSIISQASC